MNDITNADATSECSRDYLWVLRYSAIAFMIMAAHQIYGTYRLVPRIRLILEGMGAELPASTTWAMENYVVGCVLIALFSICSTAYVLTKLNTPSMGLKLGYMATIMAVVGAFSWSGWIASAMYEPIFRLAVPI